MSEKFEFLGKLGQGSFASVFKVRRQQDQQLYAFKKIKVEKITNKELNNSLNQIRILASVKCPYVIAYKEAFYDNNLKSFCLVTEFAEGGDLNAKIVKMKKNKIRICEKQVWKIALQMLFGIKALHAMNIFHRDIKPANVLLTKDDCEAKLADMNVSIISKTGFARTQTGTPYYASPQVWLQKSYDGKSDIWSYGCVLYELITLSPPFTAVDIQSLRKKIIEGEYPRLPSQYSNQLETFIRICLTKDQVKRPSSKDLLNLKIVKQRIKLFPQQKFNQNSFLPNIEQKNSMLATIKLPARNLSSVQMKLPKCNYGDQNKENKGGIVQNLSYIPPTQDHEAQKLKEMKKLPELKNKRVQSAKNPKDEKPIARKQILRREYIKKIRS